MRFLNNNKTKAVDIALVMCPGWGVIQPPVGISYLKAFLKAHGIRAKCFDFSVELYNVFPEKRYWSLNYPEHFILPSYFKRDIVPFLQPYIEQWAKKILEYTPRAVGFSLFMSNVHTSILLARQIKKLQPETLIIAGGAEVTRAKRVFADGIKGFAPLNKEIFTVFDVLVEGEGEQTLLEVLTLDNPLPAFSTVEGVCYLSTGRVVVNGARKLIDNLDIIPFPDFSDFNLENYTKKELPIVSSRGCVNRCTFCADSPLWKTYRYQSPEKVVAGIQYLVDEYGKRQFEIVDSTFNGDIDRVEQICDLLIKLNLAIQWSAKVTANKQMTFNLLKKMKQAGCCSLAYGVESGSPEVLKQMRKNIDLEIVKRVIRDTYNTGMQANCFFIIGYPTETEKDFQMTLDFIKENAKFIHRFDQVTGCHIEEDSYLGLHLGEYGIEFKEDGWYSPESTPQIRRKRIEAFGALAGQLHKHYHCEVQA